MALGSFGDLVFEVSTEKVRTFSDFKRTNSERWASHEIIVEKPKSEFIGPGLDGITFTMRFDVNFGVNPRQEMDRLVDMSRNGEVHYLIIGGKGLGEGMWKIKTLGQEWTVVDNMGNVLSSKIDVTLEEYV